MRLVALLGTTGGDVHALLLGKLLGILGVLGVGELLLSGLGTGLRGPFLSSLSVSSGGVGYDGAELAVLLVAADGLPAFDHGARGLFRVLAPAMAETANQPAALVSASMAISAAVTPPPTTTGHLARRRARFPAI